MKIIILAAGIGSRLWPLTKNTPKPLLDIGNGNTLLEQQIEYIQRSKVIDEVVLVAGYLVEQIEAKLKTLRTCGIKVTILFNPFYRTTNNLVSLWLARYMMDADFLITNGDNLFAADVFTGFVKSNSNGIFLAVSKKNKYDDDDMKVTLDAERVACVSKKIVLEQISAESPGLALVSGERARTIFVDNLSRLLRNEDALNCFWLEIFNFISTRGHYVQAWHFDSRGKWQEVDFHLDLSCARELIQLKIKDNA